MKNLTTKQKIILGIIFGIMIIVIGIYGYISLNTYDESLEILENTNINNDQVQESKTQNSQSQSEDSNSVTNLEFKQR